MSQHWTLGTLTCGPLALALVAWAVALRPKSTRPQTMALIALVLFTGCAVAAVCNFLYFSWRASSNLPPWQDSEILNFGVLFLPVLVAMLVALGAILRGAPKWPMALIGIGSLPLLFLSVMAVGAV